jgi:hypothetical protein
LLRNLWTSPKFVTFNFPTDSKKCAQATKTITNHFIKIKQTQFMFIWRMISRLILKLKFIGYGQWTCRYFWRSMRTRTVRTSHK